MPSAFVTGATGFLGSHLLAELVRQGWEVAALHREQTPIPETKGPVRWVAGDLTDAKQVMRALDRPYDAVFHTAADTSQWSAHRARQTRVNVQGTNAVLSAAAARGVGRFVHTSTVAVWGFPGGTIDESTPRDASAYWVNYAHSKALAESLVKESAVEHVILNPAHILGPGDRHNWVRLFKMVLNNRLPAIPPGAGSFADVRQVARAHVSAYHHGVPGENYLLGGVNASFQEVVRMIAEVGQTRLRRPVAPAWLMRLLAHWHVLRARLGGGEPELTPESVAFTIHREACDSSRAQAVLDYQITPLRTLVNDTVYWMKREGLV